MKKVTEIKVTVLFSEWGTKPGKKVFTGPNCEKDYEKFLLQLKELKDSVVCTENNITKLWRPVGNIGSVYSAKHGSVLLKYYHPNGKSEKVLKIETEIITQ